MTRFVHFDPNALNKRSWIVTERGFGLLVLIPRFPFSILIDLEIIISILLPIHSFAPFSLSP